MDEHSPLPQLATAEPRRIEGAARTVGRPDHDTVQVGDRFQGKVGDVLRVVEAVKGGVDIRPRVGEHVDLAHLERRTRAIAGARSVAGKPVADRGRREAGVGDHPVLDRVAQIDEPGSRGRHGALGDGGDARSGAARRAGSCP